MSVIIIGSGGGGGNHNTTAMLLTQAQSASPQMTADEHSAIVDAERRLVGVIKAVLNAVAEQK